MKPYTTDQFVSLETRVWEALVRGDAAADNRLLASEFLGVYASGFAGKPDHLKQLQAGPAVKWYELSGARILVLAEGAVLLSYKADFIRRTDGSSSARETMYVTSIWKSSAEGWQNVFSQDTPAE